MKKTVMMIIKIVVNVCKEYLVGNVLNVAYMLLYVKQVFFYNFPAIYLRRASIPIEEVLMFNNDSNFSLIFLSFKCSSRDEIIDGSWWCGYLVRPY